MKPKETTALAAVLPSLASCDWIANSMLIWSVAVSWKALCSSAQIWTRSPWRKPELIDAPSAIKWLHSNKEIAGKHDAFLLQTCVQRNSERRRTMQALLGCQADQCWCAGSFALFLGGCMCKIYYRWCTDIICKNCKINTSVAHKESRSFREQTRLWFHDLMNSVQTNLLSLT